jgi:hypothetical protein
MHFLISLVLIFGFCLLLIVGLLSVFQSLMDRDFHVAPLVTERDAQTDHRYSVADRSDAHPTAHGERSLRAGRSGQLGSQGNGAGATTR